MIHEIYDRLLNGVWTLGIPCTQWGDTGKGKIVDCFADWADIIVRGTGGANAGHTIEVGGTKHVFHLLPSGMLHAGKLNVIGSGVAVEPRIVLEELALLRQSGVSGDNLRLSLSAHLVLPQHVVLDRVKEAAHGAGKIGTTGRGMGPCYRDHVDRVGLVINDLLNPDVFVRKLSRNLEEKIRLLRTYDSELLRKIMWQDILEKGAFYHPAHVFHLKEIEDRYLAYGRELQRYITDTNAILEEAVHKKHILLEGAQGNLLSVDYGTYPFVTSSDCSIRGLSKGAGVWERDVDLALGIVKAFYMTRVGEGPFPTEFGGEKSADHCRAATRESEAAAYPAASINGQDEFVQGIAVRQAGNEYGATTGRARRTGWLDLPLLRYSSALTGPNVILTKLDVLDEAGSFRICTEYEYTGPDYWRGDRMFRAGDRLRIAVPDAEIMEHCQPLYREFPGWKTSIRGIREFSKLPHELRQAVQFVEEAAGVNVVLISVGPDREETMFVNPPRMG